MEKKCYLCIRKRKGNDPLTKGHKIHKIMARAKYYIKQQVTYNGKKEAEETFYETTRKTDAEKVFHRLQRTYKETAEVIREGYFKKTDILLTLIAETEFWIEKH